MALTALSMDNRGGIQNLDALQHYQKALPSLHDSLRSPEDLSSDLVLLTHFVLLLYEVWISDANQNNTNKKIPLIAHLDCRLRARRAESAFAAPGPDSPYYQTKKWIARAGIVLIHPLVGACNRRACSSDRWRRRTLCRITSARQSSSRDPSTRAIYRITVNYIP